MDPLHTTVSVLPALTRVLPIWDLKRGLTHGTKLHQGFKLGTTWPDLAGLAQSYRQGLGCPQPGHFPGATPQSVPLTNHQPAIPDWHRCPVPVGVGWLCTSLSDLCPLSPITVSPATGNVTGGSASLEALPGFGGQLRFRTPKRPSPLTGA